MPYDILIQNVGGLPPTYTILICEPGPAGCVSLITGLQDADLPLIIPHSQIPIQFQPDGTPFTLLMISEDPNYQGDCEPLISFNQTQTPTPTNTQTPTSTSPNLPDCFCYSVTALTPGDITYTNCATGFGDKIPLTGGQILELCSLVDPVGNITFIQTSLCINNECPQPQVSQSPTVTPTVTPTSNNNIVNPSCLDGLTILVLYHDILEYPNNSKDQTCDCYSITGSNGKYSYRDCSNNLYLSNVQFQNDITICSLMTPFINQGNLSVTKIGICENNACLSPAPTPSPSPSPFASITPINPPCYGGHNCNRTDYILLVNTTSIGNPTLNNASTSPTAGPGIDIGNISPYSRLGNGRYNQYTLTPSQVSSIVSNSNSNQITIALSCNIPPPWVCHIEPIWIRVMNDDGYLLYDDCPEYNTIILDPCVINTSQCRIPQNLTYSIIGQTVTFNWDPVLNASSYRLTILKGGFYRLEIFTSVPTHTITLSAGFNYSAFVYTNCSFGTSVSVESLPVIFTL